MKIYTKTGDAGETGLWGGQRVAKDDARVQAYGTVDECNAAIGVARAAGMETGLDAILAHIQNQLFVVGADLATPGVAANIPHVGSEEIGFLEQAIDALEQQLEPLKQFILPGGTPAAAQLHLARTICRRAERCVVGLARQEPALSAQIGVYLNRLSDCLFVLARAANAGAGVPDVPWNSPRQAGDARPEA
jgi:cob(I)alamin adenosyltransferase